LRNFRFACRLKPGTPPRPTPSLLRSASLPSHHVRKLIALAAALCWILVLCLVLPTLLGGQTVQSLAAQLTPPAPPTYVPTPIGPPPMPPTLVSASSATPQPSGTLTASPVPAATTSATLEYRLDAARVSAVGNPGNLAGLASTKPGNRVWLMMYYTIAAISRPAVRTTVYSITYKGRAIYRVTYRSHMKPSGSGRFSRYTVYDVPRTLPYGTYFYRATLSIGATRQTKTWKFALARRERPAASNSG
jgi:hypothetical protein